MSASRRRSLPAPRRLSSFELAQYEYSRLQRQGSLNPDFTACTGEQGSEDMDTCESVGPEWTGVIGFTRDEVLAARKRGIWL